MAAAAAYGSRQQHCVMLCRLLLVAVLVTGEAVADARAGAPQTDEVALHQTEHLQGFIRRSGEEAPTTTTSAAGGWPALNKEQQSAVGGRSSWRRMLVGSRAPTCTYNECRGCRHRCSAQGVPIDDSDPINSAYHYKCICHV